MSAISLIRRLQERALLVGVEVSSASAGAVEMIGGLAFDFMVIDARHAAVSVYSNELEQLLRSADLGGAPALVRVGDNTPGTINRAMNDGAAGVVVTVRAASEARAVVQSLRYPPFGQRGAAPVVRAARYGLIPWDDYLEATNHERPVIVAIDDIETIEIAGEIAAVEGVDAVVIEALGIATSAGLASVGEVLDLTAVQASLANLRNDDRVVGVGLPDSADAAAWRDAGCSLLVVGSDVQAYVRATVELRAELAVVPARIVEGAQ